MKKYLVVLAAIAIVIAMAGGALAGVSSSALSVSGTVPDRCVFITDDAAFTWADINLNSGNSAHAAAVSGTLTAKCTNGTTYTVNALSTNAQNLHGGSSAACSAGGVTGYLTTGGGGLTKEISYTFTCSDVVGQGFAAAASNLNPAASIDETNATNQVAIPAAYSDTVVVTIAY